MTAVLLSDAASSIYNYYSLEAAQGYLSYEGLRFAGADRALIYKDPLALWFELPDGAHADDQLTTGTTIYVKASIPLTGWLYGDASDAFVAWGRHGDDSTFSWALYKDYQQTSDVP